MGLTNFDELNTLSTTETTKDDRHKSSRKKIPIHDYFENMQISEEEKEKRVRLANLLLADVLNGAYVAKASELSALLEAVSAQKRQEIYKEVEILANCGRAHGKA